MNLTKEAGSGWRRAGRGTVGGMAALAMVAVMMLAPAPAKAAGGNAGQIAVGISVRVGPPPLPVYAQPICPGPRYMWTPGYWAYDPETGYYWVPGTWVLAPAPGLLWTPGYWGWDPMRTVFLWHGGYWGPQVGFYGGIDYGFGYTGVGFWGGEWRGGSFFYNRAVTNINVVNIHNVYNRTVINNVNVTRVSYNGGRDGVRAEATREQMSAERERRMGPVAMQTRHAEQARNMPSMRWSQNHGRPNVAATARPGNFRGRNVPRAKAAGGEDRGAEAGRVGGANRPGMRPFTQQQRERPQSASGERMNNGQMRQQRPQQFRGGQERPNQQRQQQMRQGDRGNQHQKARPKQEKGKPGEPHRG